MAQTDAPLAAFDKVRAEILALCTPAARKMIVECDDKIDQAVATNIVVLHQIGSRMVHALAEGQQGVYGDDFARQIVAYIPAFNHNKQFPYYLKKFAEAFDDKYVAAVSRRKMRGDGPWSGKQMTLAHWLALASIKDPAKRKETVELAIKTGLSAASVTLMLNSGDLEASTMRSSTGRRPSRPPSVMIGLQRLYKVAIKAVNLADSYETNLLPRLDDIPPADVTLALRDRLVADLKVLADLHKAVQTMDARLRGSLGRVRRVLNCRPAPPSAADGGPEDPVTAAARNQRPLQAADR